MIYWIWGKDRDKAGAYRINGLGGRDIHQEIQHRRGTGSLGEGCEFRFGHVGFGVIQR